MTSTKRAARTPEPIDQWLESHGYYRKHTARDPTCLFRAVSEQLYLTQQHFHTVREQCVQFMKSNRSLFEQEIEDSFDEYLENILSSKEFSAKFAIEAMSKMYNRDFWIFEKMAEPENITNNGYIGGEIYLFRLDNHFDSVFEKNFIQNAAFCQSIVYDTLYKKVFKLPDVRFAVSRMLHETPTENKSHIEYFSKQNVEKRKKVMERDHDWFNSEEASSPTNTSCILDVLTKCMFHNLDNKNGNDLSKSNCEMDIESDDEIEEEENSNFINNNVEDKYNANYKSSFTNYYEGKNINHDDNFDLKNTYKTIITNYFNDNDVNNINEQTENDLNETNNNNEDNSFNNNGFPDFVAKLFDLTDFCANDPNISCVKQMLNENLTPFPYKVAKALDPDIYRNIEFDTWNEIRREQRYGTWYNGGTALQVGVKCLVKLTDCQATWYHCHIQEMSSDKRGAPCLVFVEELGEKKTVPREFLQPLPLGQAKPWALPYRHYRNLASSLQGNRLLTLADYGTAKFKKTRLYKTRKEKESVNNDKSKRYSQSRGLKNESNEKLSITSDSNGNDVDFINNPLHALTSPYQNYAENRVDIVAMPVSVVLDNQNQQCNDGQPSQPKPANIDLTIESVFSNQPLSYNNDSNIQTPVTNVNNLGYMYQYNPYSANYNSAVTVAYPTSPSYSSAPLSYTQTYSNSPTTYTNSGSYPTSTAHEQSATPPVVDNFNQNYSLGTPIGPVPSYGNIGPSYAYMVPPAPQIGASLAPHNVRDINTRSQYPINFSAPKSIYPNGADLPYGDVASLRFFYNLGLEYFRMSFLPYPQYGHDQNSGVVTEDNGIPIHPQTTGPNIDQLALDFQTQLKSETPVTESNISTTNAKDNKRGTLGPRFKKNDEKNSVKFKGKSRHGHNNNNKSSASNVSTTTSEITERTLSSSPIPPRGTQNPPTLTEPPPQPYVMSYAPVPGMYGPMVPCYPVDAESATNYYVAPYMGMPYNVLPQACENAVEGYNVPEPHAYTPIMYQQPNPTTSVAVTTANAGYYQNPVWYQAPASSYIYNSQIPTSPSAVPGYNNNGQISTSNYGPIVPPPQNQSFISNNSNISQ